MRKRFVIISRKTALFMDILMSIKTKGETIYADFKYERRKLS